jgi:hypothetical protein
MKVLATAFLAIFLLALAGCGGYSAAMQGSQVPRSGVVFMGDSITGRFVVESQFNQPGYYNAGIFGQRTDEMLARFSATLDGKNVCHGYRPPDGSVDPGFPYACQDLQTPPATIVIEGGWNNFFQGNVNNSALVDIQKMADMAKARGVRVLVCTLYAYDPGHPAPWMVPTGNAPVTFYDMWRDPLNTGIRALKGVTVVDLDAEFIGQIDYTADGIHPNIGASNIEVLNTIIGKL